MRRLTLACLLLFLLAACAAPNDPLPPVTQVAATTGVNNAEATAAPVTRATPLPAGAVIAFQRSGGIIGAMDEWIIFEDGAVQYTARAEAPVTLAGALAADQVAQLTAELDALGFFGLADSYGAAVLCNDCYSYALTVSANGQTKTVTTIDSAPDAPPALLDAIDQVQALLDGLHF